MVDAIKAVGAEVAVCVVRSLTAVVASFVVGVQARVVAQTTRGKRR